ncbi:MAG: FG-GAP-like repeat-containing protein, partial [Actinomycetota bacterium]|nr:FG-GAP-like repeat-containing protein [Actinomycetota bacterium]
SVEGCIIDGGLYVQKGLDVQNFRDVRVLDNDITAVGDGVRMGGYNPSWDPRVEGNRMYGLFTYNLGGSVHGTGIELENVHDPIVRRNELDYGDAAGQTGIHLYQARNFEMEANAVHSVESGGLYGSFTGIHVRGSVSTGRVVNNMVAVMTYRRTGIYVTSSGIEIAHNTVLLAQTGIDPFGGSKALELHGTNATVVNNVFIEDGSGASVEAMKLGVSPATSLFDGNMLWSRDALIRDNGVVRSLLDWQALGHGANSIEKRDLEVVDELTDLHLQGCSGVDPDLVGIPYPTLLSDLDGQARSATEPARGADEYGGGTLPSFGASTELFVGDIPAQAAAADFDGDGDRDLVVTRLDANQPPTLALFENQGGGSFVSMGQIGLGGSDAPLILRAEDMDGDGYGDIAVSFDGTAAPHLRVHWGDGLFGFSQQTDVSASQSGTAQPDWVSDFELADVDGDADLDIVATHLGAVGVAPTGGKLMVFCQRPGRVLTTEDAVDLTNPYDIEVGDLDGDGDPDAAVQDFDGSLAWVRNVSGSCESFAQITSVAAAGSVDSAPLWPSMALADFDDDADVDLVYDDQTNPEGISLHRNDGSGSFASAESIFVESYAERLPGPLTSLDVEGDGDMDLLIGNELGSFPGQSVLLANDGTGTFGRVLVCGESTLPSPPRMLLATDLDGDMLPDVVAPTNDPDDVSIILNTGNAPPSAVLVGPTAERNTSGVDVAWSTLLEIGNAGFEVQRRIGVGSWLALDFIVGAGTTSVPQAYAYADPGASTTNLTTYRLRQEDTGGSSTYSDEVHVSAAPEPGTLAGITSGAGLLWWLDRRRQRRRRG